MASSNDTLGTVGETVLPAVNDTVDTVGGVVNDTLGTVGETVLPAVNDTVDTVGGVVNDTLGTVGETVLPAVNDTVDTVGGVVNDTLGTVSDDVLPAVNDTLGTVSDEAPAGRQRHAGHGRATSCRRRCLPSTTPSTRSARPWATCSPGSRASRCWTSTRTSTSTWTCAAPVSAAVAANANAAMPIDAAVSANALSPDCGVAGRSPTRTLRSSSCSPADAIATTTQDSAINQGEINEDIAPTADDVAVTRARTMLVAPRSLLDLDVDLDLALDLAAPIDAAIAANANIAAPIDAAVSANVLSPNSMSLALRRPGRR